MQNDIPFVRSGRIDPSDTVSTFKFVGWLAANWSSRTADTDGAYRLVVYATVYPSGDITLGRWASFSLRCLSSGLDI